MNTATRRGRLAALSVVLTLALGAGLAPASAAGEDQATTAGDWSKSARNNPHLRAFPKVVDLRHATHPHFDRVVIDLRGKRPGYRTGWTRRLSYEGSGAPVPVKGRAKLWLSLSPASAHDDRGNSVYDGPRTTRPRYDTLRAVAFTGDFEGAVTFGFALERKAAYRILTLSHPRRLVIDFRH